jgi:DNA-directed RNA polymerase subunit RPC12/RpoP
MMLTTKAPCTILVTSKSAPNMLREMSEHFYADAVDPLEYKCLRCGLQWDDSPLRSYRDVTCSNCYSERVVITMVRLGFENWGEQNGGEREQRDRYEHAKLTTRAALLSGVVEPKQKEGK